MIRTNRIRAFAHRLHRIEILRRCAKQICRHWILTQNFHGGLIALNAVSHSWAWTGQRTYETFDRELQDRLLALSLERPHFLDIGANIGAMTLSILLRNRSAKVIAVEPGVEAYRLLTRSLRINHLEARAELLNVAASAGDSHLNFDPDGSVSGHVVSNGIAVPAIDIRELIQRASGANLLIKIDVEGYEVPLIQTIANWSLPAGSCAVVELHPLGFNSIGNPIACVDQIRALEKVSMSVLGGGQIGEIDPNEFTQIELHWK